MGLTIGLDMNLTSLATAHRKGQENRWPTAFVAGDAVRLPIRDASLDNVVDFGVSEHIYDLVGWMHEILRVLKPGGVWVSVTTNYCGLLTPTFRESAGFESPWHRVLAVPFVVGRYLSGVLGHYTQRIPRVEQAYGQYHGHIPQLKRHLDPEDLNAINPWEMQRLANTVGFDSVSARVTVSNRTFFHRLLSRLANRGPLLFIVPNTVLVARKA
jgi:ubiquinone/menaquinone biosynthesis C-methylase UbiE